jgi:hypothetical protein
MSRAGSPHCLRDGRSDAHRITRSPLLHFSRTLRITSWRAAMNLNGYSDSGERHLSALNAKAEALAQGDASDWDEAVDWGTPDCSRLCASEGRAMTEPCFD